MRITNKEMKGKVAYYNLVPLYHGFSSFYFLQKRFSDKGFYQQQTMKTCLQLHFNSFLIISKVNVWIGYNYLWVATRVEQTNSKSVL